MTASTFSYRATPTANEGSTKLAGGGAHPPQCAVMDAGRARPSLPALEDPLQASLQLGRGQQRERHKPIMSCRSRGADWVTPSPLLRPPEEVPRWGGSGRSRRACQDFCSSGRLVSGPTGGVDAVEIGDGELCQRLFPMGVTTMRSTTSPRAGSAGWQTSSAATKKGPALRRLRPRAVEFGIDAVSFTTNWQWKFLNDDIAFVRGKRSRPVSLDSRRHLVSHRAMPAREADMVGMARTGHGRAHTK